MSYEEASRREMDAFEELRKAVTARGHLDPTAAIYSDHSDRYEASVKRLLTAVQAYEAAASYLKAAQRNAG